MLVNPINGRGSPSFKALRVAIVLGTRPEIVKMSPIVREFQRQDIDFTILHTGQHYNHNMMIDHPPTPGVSQ